MPKYYEINEAAAKRAKDMNSFSDYKPGSATSAYRQMVDKAYAIAERQKARVDPMYHDKIDALVDRYAKKLAANLNESHVIDGRVPSILIAGGSNFPVRKKEKQNAARDRNSTWKLRSCWIRSSLWVQAGSAPTMTLPWKSWKRNWRGWRSCKPP